MDFIECLFGCLLFCGTKRNGTPDSVKYLFYGTAQKQAKTAPHFRIIVLDGCRWFSSKYNAVIVDVLNNYTVNYIWMYNYYH